MSKERWRLLDLWLNASNVMPWEDGECRSEVAKVRKQVASPYALGSEATLSATRKCYAHRERSISADLIHSPSHCL